MKTQAKAILEAVSAGTLSVDEALLRLKTDPFEDIGYAKVDLHRRIRQGLPEVIYGAGKTPEQIAGVALTLRAEGEKCVLITRLDADKAAAVAALLAEKGDCPPLDYRADARVGIVGAIPAPSGRGTVVIATGGTSDIPVAEEAALTAQALGNSVIRLYDVGVAGLHRLLSHLDDIMGATVIIAIAGMEGALASVIGGLADCPVIAVPTSVGYGASFHGLSALLSMLNSCASGVSVVNIDNGFGAGYMANMINHMEAKP
jgi:NCAIR mutase (PurE)-related protein